MSNLKERVTVETFEQTVTETQHLELIHGEPVEKTMPTERHGVIVANLVFALKQYAQSMGKGRVSVETRYLFDDYNLRQPDVAFVREAQAPVTEKGATPQPPDLAIEVQSPDDAVRQLREKADYYLAKGVGMVWVVYPDTRLVEVYTLEKIDLLTQDEAIAEYVLLPDFVLPVRDIFAY